MRQELVDFRRIERRLAPLTCSAYEREVGTCIAHLERERLVAVDEVQPRHLRRFLAEESIRRRTFESGAGGCRAQVLLPLHTRERADRSRPGACAAHAKETQALPDVLDPRELARLLAATDRDGVWKRKHDGKRERDRLLLALFRLRRLCRSALLELDWQDIDLERRLLKVRCAKGGRQRIVPIHPALERSSSTTSGSAS